jgi:hypothetical protein
MAGFVQGLEGADGNLVSTRGDTCLLSVIPAGGDINAETHKLINLGVPVDATDATTKAYVDTAISSSHLPLQLRGFVQGLEKDDGTLDSIRGNTCLLSNIPAGGNVDMGSFRLKNLQQSPEEDFDGVSATFLWDLMHDEVQILWS